MSNFRQNIQKNASGIFQCIAYNEAGMVNQYKTVIIRGILCGVLLFVLWYTAATNIKTSTILGLIYKYAYSIEN